jgi:magnesium-transporting ATPase (P-type)
MRFVFFSLLRCIWNGQQGGLGSFRHVAVHSIDSGILKLPRCLADGCPTLVNMLVIIVGGIPIAMPTVLAVTLALGAYK